LVPALLVDRDYAMAARALRRAYATDTAALSVSATAGLRRALANTPHTVREQLVASTVEGLHEGYFLLGAYLCLTGDQVQGAAILRLHDLRVGGDPVAAAIGGFPAVHTVSFTTRKLTEGRTLAALAGAMSEHAAAPTRKTLGMCVALMLSAGELAGAEALLVSSGSLTPEWPTVSPQNPWDAAGVTSAILKSADGLEFKPVVPTPALALGLTLLGQGEVARALAVEATAGELSQESRRTWQSVLEVPALPSDWVDPRLEASLRDAGVLPTLPGVFEAVSKSRPADAATLLLRMPEADRKSPGFQLARGLTLLLQGREDDALPALTSWLETVPAGGPITPRLAPLMPPTMAASFLGPPFRGEPPVRLMLRFVLAHQSSGDTRLHIEEMVLAGKAYTKHAALMRSIVGNNGPAAAESGAILARQAMELGDTAFRNREYAAAKGHYLRAGQLDEATPGLAKALLRGAVATGQFDLAAAKLLELLTALGDPKAADGGGAALLARFTTGVAAAYSYKADFDAHRAQLAAFADSKKLLESVWLLWGVMESEAGNKPKAIEAFDGVIRMGGRLEPWARAYKARMGP